jgi:hypothetical protein
MFGLDPDPEKRSRLIERLLQSDAYAENWAGYWRDVIFSRATDRRALLSRGVFEEWMRTQLGENRGWDKIVKDLITATGDVRENGQTALIFAHQGQAEEIAAETSRIFLGIQIQCANCHDPGRRQKSRSKNLESRSGQDATGAQLRPARRTGRHGQGRATHTRRAERDHAAE